MVLGHLGYPMEYAITSLQPLLYIMITYWSSWGTNITPLSTITAWTLHNSTLAPPLNNPHLLDLL